VDRAAADGLILLGRLSFQLQRRRTSQFASYLSTLISCSYCAWGTDGRLWAGP